MRLRQCFANIDWQCIINQPIGEEKLQVYSNLIETGMSNIIPESSMKPNLRMRPWLASTTAAARLLFQQIRSVYQFCRNTVNKERKWRKDNYGFAFFCLSSNRHGRTHGHGTSPLPAVYGTLTSSIWDCHLCYAEKQPWQSFKDLLHSLLVNLRTRRNPHRHPQVSIPPKEDIKCQVFAALLILLDLADCLFCIQSWKHCGSW